MIIRPLATLLAATLATAVHAAPESFTLDSRHSFPSFHINHLGLSLQMGRFNKATGKITIDREARQGSVDLAIDAASMVRSTEPCLASRSMVILPVALLNRPICRDSPR